MDKLKYSIFDFYTYFIPGSLVVFTGYLCLTNLLGQDFNFFIEHMKEMSIKLLFVLIPFSFLTGFIISELSSLLSDVSKKIKALIKLKLYKKNENNTNVTDTKLYSTWFHKLVDKREIKLTFNKGESYVILREFSKENYNAVEQYNVYKTMCNNLIYSLILCNVFIQLYHFNLMILAVSIIFCIVLYYSKIKFNNWGRNEIQSSIELLILNPNYTQILEELKKKRKNRI